MSQNLREVSAAPLIVDEMQMSSGQRGWGYVFAALGAVLFSMKAILIKLAYQPGGGLEENAVDVVTLLVLRMGFALPVYLAIGLFVIRRRVKLGQDLPNFSLFLKAGILGCTGYYACAFLDFQGLKFITAQLERLLLFTYPAFVVILGAIFFGGRITKTSLACIALAYAGIAIIFAGGDIATGENVVLGSALLIACAILFALFQLFAKPMVAGMGSPLFTCAAMTSAAMIIGLHFLTKNLSGEGLEAALNLPPRIYVLGAMMAVFSTLIPSFLINIALGRIGAQAVATIGMISPIATIGFAVFLLGEPFGWVDALGTLLTIFGIGLYTWLDKRANSQLKLGPSS